MTTMTVKSPTRTRSATYTHEYESPASQSVETRSLAEEVTAWTILAGFAAICFFIFAVAIGLHDARRDKVPTTSGRSAIPGGSLLAYLPIRSSDMNASCGMSTLPTRFMRFLPSFCFSSSLRLRVTSPP